MDFCIFLIFIESDLKEIGIMLFGFKRKMMFVIVCWYSSVCLFGDVLELVYVDWLEVEM